MRNIKNDIEVIESISIYECVEGFVKSVRVLTSNDSAFIIEYDKSTLLKVGDKINTIVNRGVK